jgi:hypothetical protein
LSGGGEIKEKLRNCEKKFKNIKKNPKTYHTERVHSQNVNYQWNSGT